MFKNRKHSISYIVYYVIEVVYYGIQNWVNPLNLLLIHITFSLYIKIYYIWDTIIYIWYVRFTIIALIEISFLLLTGNKSSHCVDWNEIYFFKQNRYIFYLFCVYFWKWKKNYLLLKVCRGQFRKKSTFLKWNIFLPNIFYANVEKQNLLILLEVVAQNWKETYFKR